MSSCSLSWSRSAPMVFDSAFAAEISCSSSSIRRSSRSILRRAQDPSLSLVGSPWSPFGPPAQAERRPPRHSPSPRALGTHAVRYRFLFGSHLRCMFDPYDAIGPLTFDFSCQLASPIHVRDQLGEACLRTLIAKCFSELAVALPDGSSNGPCWARYCTTCWRMWLCDKTSLTIAGAVLTWLTNRASEARSML